MSVCQWSWASSCGFLPSSLRSCELSSGRKFWVTFCSVAIHNPLTGCEPNLLDNFNYSETSAAIFQDESGDIDTEPSHSCDAELDDEIIGKALSSPLFIQEREEPANLRQAYHSYEESLLPVLFRTHTQVRRAPYTNLVRLKNGNQVATWKTKESGFSRKSELRSRSTNFKLILIEEVPMNFLELVILSGGKFSSFRR